MKIKLNLKYFKHTDRNFSYNFEGQPNQNDLYDQELEKLLNIKNLKTENISLCRVQIGGFEDRTKCLEDIPADIEINTDESSLRSINIYPYSPIHLNKESYAIVLKANNPRKSGLYQFHSYGQFKGKSVSSYLGSWTIVID